MNYVVLVGGDDDGADALQWFAAGTMGGNP